MNTIKRYNITKGLDIPIVGQVAKFSPEESTVSQVAVIAEDYIGMKPRMAVQIGDTVKRGQVLFENRKTKGILFTSPGAGTIKEINRGKMRALQSVVIDLDESETKAGGQPAEVEYTTYKSADIKQWSSAEIRAFLIETGMWAALRMRPFDKTPPIKDIPRSIFVTATDTNPLAPEVASVLKDRLDDFTLGLKALALLADENPIHLCTSPGLSFDGVDIESVTVHQFDGPHPSGTVGLHIHIIDPVNRERAAWHIGYQDTVALGALIRTGKQDFTRTISVAGPAAPSPKIIKTRVGARLHGGILGDDIAQNIRVISGSVLFGRAVAGEIFSYLGRFCNQVTLIEELEERFFMGWLKPGRDTFSVTKLFLSSFLPKKKYSFKTGLNGGKRALVSTGGFEAIMPFDLMPQFLLRALISNDIERSEALGCLELSEEDLGLANYICASKINYSEALRNILEQIEKEG